MHSHPIGSDLNMRKIRILRGHSIRQIQHVVHIPVKERIDSILDRYPSYVDIAYFDQLIPMRCNHHGMLSDKCRAQPIVTSIEIFVQIFSFYQRVDDAKCCAFI